MPTRPPTHQPPRGPRPEQRPNSAARGYGHRWRKLRAAHLAAHPFCEDCGLEATEVDHVTSKRRQGTDDEANLRSLCKSCHSKKTCRVDGGLGGAGQIPTTVPG